MTENNNEMINWHARLSVAPMMDWTDRHCRYLHRLMSKHTLLYTEMVTSPALVRGGALRLLRFDPAEHPLAVQLGGSNPKELSQATRICADHGFDEVNLNVGCPSDRVQSGSFGAVLMLQPELVGHCVSDMIAASNVEITIKCRIGVDEQNPQETLPIFLQTIRDAGVRRVTIHARKAWLKGLSPKENRSVPPLDYDLVLQMKQQFPDLHISVNGGVETLEQAQGFLQAGLDGVMIGRAAYHTPDAILLGADAAIFSGQSAKSTFQIVDEMRPYIDRHLADGGRLNAITRHMLALFSGRPGARGWRRTLSERSHVENAGLEVLDAALLSVQDQPE